MRYLCSLFDGGYTGAATLGKQKSSEIYVQLSHDKRKPNIFQQRGKGRIIDSILCNVGRGVFGQLHVFLVSSLTTRKTSDLNPTW